MLLSILNIDVKIKYYRFWIFLRTVRQQKLIHQDCCGPASKLITKQSIFGNSKCSEGERKINWKQNHLLLLCNKQLSLGVVVINKCPKSVLNIKTYIRN